MISLKQIGIVGAAAAILIFSGCVTSGSPSVTRVSADTVTDLSGYWNDTDVRIVANSLIAECLESPQLSNFSRDTGRLPVVIVGTFRNDSDEHIDTSILTKRMEAALVNSGEVDFVASSSERGEIRTEREEQQMWASEDTAKRLANETGADFMMLGSVKTMLDQAGNTAVRTYMVYAELINVETNRKIWIGENREIKKIIERSSYRP